MNIDFVHTYIGLKGKRITKIRKAIISIVSEAHCLMTQADILESLEKVQLHPNRSTIFRELQFLTANNIVIKSTIANKEYFEIPKSHHHHLVCLKCHSILRVDIGNHLATQEKQISKQFNHTIVHHSLEFFGYCHTCQV